MLEFVGRVLLYLCQKVESVEARLFRIEERLPKAKKKIPRNETLVLTDEQLVDLINIFNNSQPLSHILFSFLEST